jgi:hypothetical protein
MKKIQRQAGAGEALPQGHPACAEKPCRNHSSGSVRGRGRATQDCNAATAEATAADLGEAAAAVAPLVTAVAVAIGFGDAGLLQEATSSSQRILGTSFMGTLGGETSLGTGVEHLQRGRIARKRDAEVARMTGEEPWREKARAWPRDREWCAQQFSDPLGEAEEPDKALAQRLGALSRRAAALHGCLKQVAKLGEDAKDRLNLEASALSDESSLWRAAPPPLRKD